MNPEWFGDSYDIVKRFFVENLQSIEYSVVVDPMLTGKWDSLEDEKKFYRFLRALPLGAAGGGKTALLLDPDTGIGQRRTKRHVTIAIIASHLRDHEIVFAYDQSFSRARDATVEMKEKMAKLEEEGYTGFYYDSHAKFLFAARSDESLNAVEQQLLSTGLPESRLVKLRNT